MRYPFRLGLCLLAIGPIGATTTSTTTFTDPYTIFEKARERLEASRYPDQLSYEVIETVKKNNEVSTAQYRSYYDSTTGAVRVIGVTDEELEHPYKPRGINTYLNLFGSGKGIPLSSAQRTFDYLGVPLLAPNYWFGVAHYVPHKSDPDYEGLVQEIRREFHEPPKTILATPPAQSGLKTIASVQAIYRDYVIQLLGVETFHGHDDYHLALHPLHEPDRYRLRQMWVSTNTFSLDQIVTQGNFVFGGAAGVSWTTDFVIVDGGTYIASEHTDEAFSDFRHNYDSATISFTDIEPATIPPYVWISNFRVNPETGIPPLIEPM